MKRFQFSLQKVLDIKQKNIEQEEIKLGQIIKSLEDENSRLKDYVEQKESLQLEIIVGATKGISIIEINQSQDYINHLHQLIHNQKQKIVSIKDLLSKKQNEIIELKIDEKKWTTLKDKRKQEYLLEYNQMEQKELDEIASQLMYK